MAVADPFSTSLIPMPEDEALVAPDVKVLAKNIVDSKKRQNKRAPKEANLAQAITEVAYNPQLSAPNTLVISIYDPEWVLFDSGLWDTDENSQIDPIDVNYPDGSRYWWRFTNLSNISGADETYDLTFMVREAVYLMHLFGPLKFNRAQVTRAEAIKALCDRVKEGHIDFHSTELKIKQPIDPIASGATGTVKASALPGASGSSGHQYRVVASSEDDPPGAAGFYGPLPADARGFSVLSATGDSTDKSTAGMALTPGSIWPKGGQMIITNPANGKSVTVNPVDIGAGDSYHPVIGIYPQTRRDLGLPDNWNGEVIIQAGPGAPTLGGRATNPTTGGGSGGPGGGASSTVTTIQDYFFEVNSGESFYAAMYRWAQEVAWELFWDGNRLFYDSEMALIKSRIAATVHRGEAQLDDWSGTWDARQIATTMTLIANTSMFALHPGEVIEVKDFGPMSTGSTAQPKRPGCWLIDTIQRNKSDIFSTVNLKMPAKAKNEPAPQIKTTTVAGGGSAGGVTARGGVAVPFQGTTGRLDMGVDGNATAFFAPYNGTFHIAPRSGWPGQGTYCYIVNDDQSGPDYTRAIYYAEGMSPSVPSGHVTQGQRIGNPVASGGNGTPGNFEIGPANTSNGEALAKNYGLGSAGARGMVLAFYNWLRSAGIGPTTDSSNAGNA